MVERPSWLTYYISKVIGSRCESLLSKEDWLVSINNCSDSSLVDPNLQSTWSLIRRWNRRWRQFWARVQRTPWRRGRWQRIPSFHPWGWRWLLRYLRSTGSSPHVCGKPFFVWWTLRAWPSYGDRAYPFSRRRGTCRRRNRGGTCWGSHRWRSRRWRTGPWRQCCQRSWWLLLWGDHMRSSV